MKSKKLSLDALTVDSFVTGPQADKFRGGVTGTLGCYSQVDTCACDTAAPKTCMEP